MSKIQVRVVKRSAAAAADNDDANEGYNLGRSSLMEAILKNQLRHVSLAVSFTSSTVKDSDKKQKIKKKKTKRVDKSDLYQKL